MCNADEIICNLMERHNRGGTVPEITGCEVPRLKARIAELEEELDKRLNEIFAEEPDLFAVERKRRTGNAKNNHHEVSAPGVMGE